MGCVCSKNTAVAEERQMTPLPPSKKGEGESKDTSISTSTAQDSPICAVGGGEAFSPVHSTPSADLSSIHTPSHTLPASPALTPVSTSTPTHQASQRSSAILPVASDGPAESDAEVILHIVVTPEVTTNSPSPTHQSHAPPSNPELEQENNVQEQQESPPPSPPIGTLLPLQEVNHKPHIHTPYTIHHIPYTIHHIPYTIHHIPYTIYHIPYTIYHIPYT
ncbi:hypothetical protein EON63_19710, partial [archaeon]